jgi:hypothetical protein
MDNESLRLHFSKKIEVNYRLLEKFYNDNLLVFCELTSLRNEILSCILLGLNQASIFTTNHLMERILKLSLIKKYTLKYNYLNTVLYNQKIKEAIEKYDGIILNKSIELALSENIISKEQEIRLKELKNEFRNPFSHAEVSKINAQAPEFFKGHMFSFEEVKNNLINNNPIQIPEQIEISTSSPAIAQFYQENVSKENAYSYFEEIYTFLKVLEGKFDEMKQTNV